MNNGIKQQIIAAGVRNLKEFGYPDCDSVSILGDRVYSVMFDRMLEEHPVPEHRAVVAELRAKIAEATRLRLAADTAGARRQTQRAAARAAKGGGH